MKEKADDDDSAGASAAAPTRMLTSSAAMAGGSGSSYHQINRGGSGRPRECCAPYARHMHMIRAHAYADIRYNSDAYN